MRKTWLRRLDARSGEVFFYPLKLGAIRSMMQYRSRAKELRRARWPKESSSWLVVKKIDVENASANGDENDDLEPRIPVASHNHIIHSYLPLSFKIMFKNQIVT